MLGLMSKPLNRRQFLEGSGSAAAASLLAAGQASAQAPTALAAINQSFLFEGKTFDPALVVDAARILAQRPVVPLVATDLPDGYATLPFDLYSGIRAQPAR